MATTFNHTIAAGTGGKSDGFSPLAKFMTWSKRQEGRGLYWLGLGLVLHGCVITPLAFMVVVMSGVNLFLLAMVMLAIVSVLIVNLAALPTKVSIPVFFASVALDLAIIASCAISGFNLY